MSPFQYLFVPFLNKGQELAYQILYFDPADNAQPPLHQIRYWSLNGFILPPEYLSADAVRQFKKKSSALDFTLENEFPPFIYKLDIEYLLDIQFQKLIEENENCYNYNYIMGKYQFKINKYQETLNFFSLGFYEQKEQNCGYMLARIFAEPYLANLFNVQIDYQKSLDIILQNIIHNGLFDVDRQPGQSSNSGALQLSSSIYQLFIYVDCLPEYREAVWGRAQSDILLNYLMSVGQSQIGCEEAAGDLELQLLENIKNYESQKLFLLIADLFNPRFLGYSLENDFYKIQESYVKAIQHGKKVGLLRLYQLGLQLQEYAPNDSKVKQNMKNIVQKIFNNKGELLTSPIYLKSKILQVDHLFSEQSNLSLLSLFSMYGNSEFLTQYFWILRQLLKHNKQSKQLDELLIQKHLCKIALALNQPASQGHNEVIAKSALLQQQLDFKAQQINQVRTEYNIQSSFNQMELLAFCLEKGYYLQKSQSQALEILKSSVLRQSSKAQEYTYFAYKRISKVAQKYGEEKMGYYVELTYWVLISSLQYQYNYQIKQSSDLDVTSDICQILIELADLYFEVHLKNNLHIFKFAQSLPYLSQIYSLTFNNLQALKSHHDQNIVKIIQLSNHCQMKLSKCQRVLESFNGRSPNVYEFQSNLLSEIIVFEIKNFFSHFKQLKILEQISQKEQNQFIQNIDEIIELASLAVGLENISAVNQQETLVAQVLSSNQDCLQEQLFLPIQYESGKDLDLELYQYQDTQTLPQHIQKQLLKCTHLFSPEQFKINEKNVLQLFNVDLQEGILCENHQQCYTHTQLFDLEDEHQVQRLKEFIKKFCQFCQYTSPFVVKIYGAALAQIDNHLQITQFYEPFDLLFPDYFALQEQPSSKKEMICYLINTVSAILNVPNLSLNYINSYNLCYLNGSPIPKFIDPNFFSVHLKEAEYPDFSRFLNRHSIQSISQIGQEFTPPEILKGFFENEGPVQVNHQAIIWSIGIIIYQIITEDLFIDFDSLNDREAFADKYNQSAINQKVYDKVNEESIQNIILQCLQLDPQQRLNLSVLSQNFVPSLSPTGCQFSFDQTLISEQRFTNIRIRADKKYKSSEENSAIQVYLPNRFQYIGQFKIEEYTNQNTFIIRPFLKGQYNFGNQVIFESDMHNGNSETIGSISNYDLNLMYEGSFVNDKPLLGVFKNRYAMELSYKKGQSEVSDDLFSQTTHFVEFEKNVHLPTQELIQKNIQNYESEPELDISQTQSLISVENNSDIYDQILKFKNWILAFTKDKVLREEFKTINIDLNNNLIKKHIERNEVLAYKCNFSQGTLIYIESISSKQLFYFDIFQYGLISVNGSKKKSIEQQILDFSIFDQVVKGIFYSNNGAKYNGKFKNFVLLKGIKDSSIAQLQTNINNKLIYEGVFKLNDSLNLKGQIINKQFNGYVDAQINQKFIFRGQFQDNLPHGKGILKSFEGQLIFKGLFKEGQFKYGTYYLTNQDYFQGAFTQEEEFVLFNITDSDIFKTKTMINGTLHIKDINEPIKSIKGKFANSNYKNLTGQYQIQYKNGDLFIGKLINGVPDGPGQILYQNGNRLYGTFSNHQVNSGVAFLSQKEGSKSYDKLIGQTIVLKDDSQQKFILEGQGQKFFSDRGYDLGVFINDKLEGFGQQVENIRQQDTIFKIKYTGNFKQGAKSGFGVLKQSNKELNFILQFEGNFQNNKMNGLFHAFRIDEESKQKQSIGQIYYQNGLPKFYVLSYIVNDKKYIINASKAEYDTSLKIYTPNDAGTIQLENNQNVIVQCQLDNIVQDLQNSDRFQKLGIITDSSKQSIYQGYFDAKLQYDGQGLLYKNGQIIYKGQFKENKYHGEGEQFIKNKSLKGQFFNGKLNSESLTQLNIQNPSDNLNIAVKGCIQDNYSLNGIVEADNFMINDCFKLEKIQIKNGAFNTFYLTLNN